ncbi:MAG: hypothetical protein HUK21_07040 [Fibrobacteraceae bacterium]|nr:hypothetical protein [Fibrobacteraceae bacterium]
MSKFSIILERGGKPAPKVSAETTNRLTVTLVVVVPIQVGVTRVQVAVVGVVVVVVVLGSTPEVGVTPKVVEVVVVPVARGQRRKATVSTRPVVWSSGRHLESPCPLSLLEGLQATKPSSRPLD